MTSPSQGPGSANESQVISKKMTQNSPELRRFPSPSVRFLKRTPRKRPAVDLSSTDSAVVFLQLLKSDGHRCCCPAPDERRGDCRADRGPNRDAERLRAATSGPGDAGPEVETRA